MDEKRYLTAKEAAAELEISLPTLYAYVSRGLIRSEAAEGRSRQRRYHAEDVAALKGRKTWRRDPARAAETTLHFGAPVLESAITLIDGGRFYYRGHDALELAITHSFEEVASLLWRNELSVHGLFDVALPDLSRYQALGPQLDGLTPVERFQAALPVLAAEDLSAYDLSPAAVMQTGARILHLLTLIATGQRPPDTIATTLQQCWSPTNKQAAGLLNQALILCADHELNVSSFTARCVASAGATPYAAVVGGLAALQGVKHGGHTGRIEALFREVGTPEQARPVITSRLKRGEGFPGFGHRLYPDGDPRAVALLAGISAVYPDAPTLHLARAILQAVHEATASHPTLDFGLVTLAYTLNLPPGAALTLFALGRSAGWIGHALEQYAADQMIRPRARYTGRPPER